MKKILIFQNGEFLKSISYKNKNMAKKQYTYFKKYGILNPENGEKIKDVLFELI